MNTCNNNEASSSNEQQSPLHGDILQSILSHVPLIHLIPASHVSKTWSTTVTTTTKTITTTTKPWLIIHTQTSRHPYPTQTHIYDPDSSSWIQIIQPSIKYISSLRSSHSNLLYMISPSHLSFSSDPMHVTWHHLLAPKIWRVDPVVAHVGDYVIVAGGVCDFEDDDKLAVEVYDLSLYKWRKSNPMPEVFSQSGSATWLSVSCDERDKKVFVMERSSGVTCCFDVVNNAWSGVYNLRPDPRVVYSVIGYLSDNRMIVVGRMCENDKNVIKVYGVSEDLSKCDEISEMPLEFVECLKRGCVVMTSFDVVMAGNVMYVFSKEWGCEFIVMCEFVGNGGCKWSKVVNMVVKGGCVNVMDRMVYSCGRVGMEELRGAMRSGDRKFVVKR
ncbi:F-box domain, cyclin-like protein [Artemisia annua]|uniref:F-box domain, cyclin-like protein n=1 Tax=Artemisia annua TaxID=35608 RepID=A0A2U1NEL7_ARTAN|nr:F-box domain, cyclin-like protein [Artemisia annua]